MSTAPNSLQGKLLFPFIAPPNGGKGTQTRILSQRYQLPTFDMGATFRAILKEGSDPQLAEELNSYMGAGKLVPIETVMKVFTKGFQDLASRHPDVKGFILDGFPRNVDQAEALLVLCNQWDAKVAKMIYLEVPMDVVERRATGRRFCSRDAGHVYNINDPQFMPKGQRTDADGNTVWLCDIDNAELIIRADDEPETVTKRLAEYQQETDPIIERFRQRGELADIDGNQAPEKVTQAIEAVMQPLLNLSPAP